MLLLLLLLLHNNVSEGNLVAIFAISASPVDVQLLSLDSVNMSCHTAKPVVLVQSDG